MSFKTRYCLGSTTNTTFGLHIELNEDPNQAAIREVKEEVGLDIELYERLLPFKEQNKSYKELIPPFFMNIHKISDTHKHLAMVYFAKSNENTIRELNNEKRAEWKWMTKKEIEDATDIKSSIKFYALKALDELSGK